ncbi:hypothetical protein [Bythopirellula goksoeyrii]|uniref:Uncharacterized protein n=1 Tax=Bythopirellula goksoeyrii TaxID=1400387 RepID=A0A5B9Q7N3_9BACT|nr:hypothetical protein [Bythopirellula goksoeyrii]QEG33679.1 hypothetical protein Pr1d_09430 [Bythopirellula goksoeyrii]
MFIVAASQAPVVFLMWILPTVLIATIGARSISKNARVRVAAIVIGVLAALGVFAILFYADERGWWNLSLWWTGAAMVIATALAMVFFSVIQTRFTAGP